MSDHPLKASRQAAALGEEFLLNPDVVFLNHGSFGACPRPVFEAYQHWQRELEWQPVEFLGRRFNSLMETARTALAGYLGVRPDEVAYVPNATHGVNIVARSLALRPGDEVLSTNHEYGACDRTWEFLCARQGARYRRMPVALPVHSTEQVIDSIWAGVTAATRVLFFSHITSPTAIMFPAAELLRRARSAGILTVVDGAHAPGQIDLNLGALGADFYTGNLHKWALAPKGAAFLYARHAVQHLLEPLIVSWGWSSETPGPSRFIDEQEWQGTRDIAAYLAAPAAIQFMAEHDWPAVRRQCHALLAGARQRISMLTGLPLITPEGPAWYGQMAALPLPPCDGIELKRRLYEEYRVEVPVTNWQDRLFLRVSIQGYNTADDVDRLLAALIGLLPEFRQGSAA